MYFVSSQKHVPPQSTFPPAHKQHINKEHRRHDVSRAACAQDPLVYPPTARLIYTCAENALQPLWHSLGVHLRKNVGTLSACICVLWTEFAEVYVQWTEFAEVHVTGFIYGKHVCEFCTEQRKKYVWTLHGCGFTISVFVCYHRDKTKAGNNTWACGRVSVTLLVQVVRYDVLSY